MPSPIRVSLFRKLFPVSLFVAGAFGLAGCDDSSKTNGQAPPPDAEALKRRQEMEDFAKKTPDFGKTKPKAKTVP